MLPSKDDIFSMYNKVSNRVKQYALNMTPLELKVDEATSGEPWGPHGTTMAEISRAAFDYENYKQIMGVIARRLQSEGENWRHVYKSLLLLEYMTKHGPQKVVDELSSNLSVIEKLQRFEYLDKNSKDWGLNVRQRAKELCNLISSPERVRNERQKAKQNESKYTGVSADESRMGFGFGSNSSSAFAGGGSSSFGGGSALSGMGGGGSSAIGGKGYGPSTGFGSAGGGYDSSPIRYDDDMDLGHQPLSAEDLEFEDEDAREATRKRIESLRHRLPESGDATKTTPLKGGRAPQLVAEAESKAPKRLSQVRVNPSIAASLGVSSRGASPAPLAPSTVQAAAAAPALDLFGDSEPAPGPAAPASVGAGTGSSWDAFGGPQTLVQPPAAGQDDWSSLLDGGGGGGSGGGGSGAPAPADPFAALAAPTATAALSADPFAGPAGMSSAPTPADPFADFSSVQKRAAGPIPLAPAPQKPVQDPFAALTSASDPFAPPAPKAHSPLKSAGFGQAARASDPFAPSPSAATGRPAAGSGTLSASPRAGQALPEDMFASPLPAPVFGLGAQSFTGATAGSPKMQSASPTRFGQPANNGGFGAFAAAQAGGARTEDLFGSMTIGGTKPQGPSAEALGGGMKMAPNLPQPSMPPPVTKKDPFAGLAGF